MFARRRDMLGGFRLGCGFGFLLFFFTARSTHKRKATDQNEKRSHASDSAAFALRTATTK
jgi:hypothetical protein